MSIARSLPEKIVVAGDGQLGVLAALALRRALPVAEITVIGTPPDPGAWADRIGTALPFTNRLHDKLGIEEEQLVRQAGASHRLVTRYFGWGGSGHAGVASYGQALDARLNAAFAKEWGGGSRTEANGLQAGSVAEALANAGQFMLPSGEVESPLGDLDYALRWNVPAYRNYLISFAARANIQHMAGAIGAVEADGEGGIAALKIVGGQGITADFFLDCTGPKAHLLSQLPAARRVDWSGMLPVRKVWLTELATPMLALEDRFTLTRAGWLGEFAGRDGKLDILGSGDGIDEQTAQAELSSGINEIVEQRSGRAEHAWIGNVIALGDAAAHFEPLGWLNLDFAHRQLALLVELLPGKVVDPLERAEFNRRAELMADRARDIVASHYAAPMADENLRLTRSAELTRALDQVTRRGRMPFFEESALLQQEWLALFQAVGIPIGQGPLTRLAGNGEGARMLAAMASKCAAALRAAPPYAQWLKAVIEPSLA